MVPLCCGCNYATIGHIGLQIFSFIVLSVIIAPRNVLNSHISKTHLPSVLLNVRELEFDGYSKKQSKKKRGPLLREGWKPPNELERVQMGVNDPK